jgi:hypothetical protein
MYFASVRFPNLRGCQYDVDKIREMVQGSNRKGLLTAQSPEMIVEEGSKVPSETDEHWLIM